MKGSWCVDQRSGSLFALIGECSDGANSYTRKPNREGETSATSFAIMAISTDGPQFTGRGVWEK
ncbi:hypothetical protein MYX75_04000, partial [Acidobacteria bacterium AH-259-A15]|nr:hypothetical protein [Acidobacteria bacterium AH-259-A15]